MYTITSTSSQLPLVFDEITFPDLLYSRCLLKEKEE
jgi:hypothetical protein